MDFMTALRLHSIARYAAIAILAASPLLLAACVGGGVYYGPPRHYHYYPHYYDYYFYPSARVYFQFTTGYYFYFDGTVWIRTRTLPAQIRIDATDRVRIRVDSDRPYTRYSEHSRIYHPPSPTYRPRADVNRKERDANKRWYDDYRKQGTVRRPPGRGGD